MRFGTKSRRQRKQQSTAISSVVTGRVAETLEDRLVLSAAFDLIGLTAARNDPAFAGIDGSGIGIAIIDTGVDATHRDLSGNVVRVVDIVNSGNQTPIHPHGTHVAGTSASTDPEIGVATNASIVGIQGFFPTAQGPRISDTNIEEALQWVIDNQATDNIRVINMSLGGGFYQNTQGLTSVYLDELRTLERMGVTIVSAAGNSYGAFRDSRGNLTSVMYPNSGAPGIVSTLNVGAVWEENEGRAGTWSGGVRDNTTGPDEITSFSQRPPLPTNAIFAPGAFIRSTIPGNRYANYAGTSMASPMVAGAVALMQQAAIQFGGRYLATTEIQNILISTANTIFDGDDEDSRGVGFTFDHTDRNYPRMNVHSALQEIERIFDEIAPDPPDGNGDPNGTIQGAFAGPILGGSNEPTGVVNGEIGVDGGETQVGNTDVDIIRFEVEIPGTVTIETKSANPQVLPIRDFDTILRLFDGDGNELQRDDDGGVGQFSKLDRLLQPGVYYVGVSGFDNGAYDPTIAGSGVAAATGTFTLNFALSSADPNGQIPGAVHVDFGGPSEPTHLPGFIGFDYGVPTGSQDVDIFRLEIPDDGILFIDLDSPYDDTFVDSYLRIFDENGTQLAFSDDTLSFDANGNFTEFRDSGSELVYEHPVDRSSRTGHRTDAFIAGTVTRGSVFYAGVSDFENRSYNPNSLVGRNASGSGGRYEIKFSFVNNDLNGSIPQAVDESAETLPLANRLGIIGADGIPGSSPVQVQTVGDRDVDFIRVRPDSNGILELDVDSYGSDNSFIDGNDSFGFAGPVDAFAYIFDAQGNVLAENDDTDGLDPFIRLEVTANTDYYIAVTGYGNHGFDPFQLGSGTPGDTGRYIFNVELLPLDDEEDFADDVIPYFAGQSLAAQSLVDGQSMEGFIGADATYVRGATDVDLFQFVAGRTGRFSVAANPNGEFSTDPVIRVFDSQGNEIASNDDFESESARSEVRVDLVEGQTYFVGVTGAGPNSRTYNPQTGAGTGDGAIGDYIVNVISTDIANLDLDGDGTVSATTDGNLLLGRLFGLSAVQLEPFRSAGATRSGAEIVSYIDAVRNRLFDMDGDGSVVASTDGNLVLARLFGLTQAQFQPFVNASGTGANVVERIRSLREVVDGGAPGQGTEQSGRPQSPQNVSVEVPAFDISEESVESRAEFQVDPGDNFIASGVIVDEADSGPRASQSSSDSGDSEDSVSDSTEDGLVGDLIVDVMAEALSELSFPGG